MDSSLCANDMDSAKIRHPQGDLQSPRSHMLWQRWEPRMYDLDVIVTGISLH